MTLCRPEWNVVDIDNDILNWPSIAKQWSAHVCRFPNGGAANSICTMYSDAEDMSKWSMSQISHALVGIHIKQNTIHTHHLMRLEWSKPLNWTIGISVAGVYSVYVVKSVRLLQLLCYADAQRARYAPIDLECVVWTCECVLCVAWVDGFRVGNRPQSVVDWPLLYYNVCCAWVLMRDDEVNILQVVTVFGEMAIVMPFQSANGVLSQVPIEIDSSVVFFVETIWGTAMDSYLGWVTDCSSDSNKWTHLNMFIALVFLNVKTQDIVVHYISSN